jgi:hypothetical protein
MGVYFDWQPAPVQTQPLVTVLISSAMSQPGNFFNPIRGQGLKNCLACTLELFLYKSAEELFSSVLLEKNRGSGTESLSFLRIVRKLGRAKINEKTSL